MAKNDPWILADYAESIECRMRMPASDGEKIRHIPEFGIVPEVMPMTMHICFFERSTPGTHPRLHRLVDLNRGDPHFFTALGHHDLMPGEEMGVGVGPGEAGEPNG
jgi:hypothetical protein